MSIVDSTALFWEHHSDLLNEFRTSQRSSADPIGKLLRETCSSPTATVERAFALAKDMIPAAQEGDFRVLESLGRDTVWTALVYMETWGRDDKVTSGELDGSEEVDPRRSQLERLEALVKEKGHDYNSGGVPILSYFVWQERSIVHEIHKRAQRLYSIDRAGSAKFEGAASTAFDLCSFALFLLAYLRTFGQDPLNRYTICSYGYIDAIVGTLCYLRRDGLTLVLRSDDRRTGACNGLGGKVEGAETPRSCAMREIAEECGLQVTDLALRGIVTVVGERTCPWHLFIYTGSDWVGEPRELTSHGTLEWVPDHDLPQLSLGQGDRYFLERLDMLGWFEGVLEYRDGALVRHDFVQHGDG